MDKDELYLEYMKTFMQLIEARKEIDNLKQQLLEIRSQMTVQQHMSMDRVSY